MTTDHQHLAAAIRELVDQLQGCSLDEIQVLGRGFERLVEYREPAKRDPAAPRDLAQERRRALIDALFLDIMDEERRRAEEQEVERQRAAAEAAHREELAQWGDPQQTVFSSVRTKLALSAFVGEPHDGVEITRRGGR